MEAAPIIDVAPLLDDDADPGAVDAVASEIDAACRHLGFFLIRGHGVSADLTRRLESAARSFFILPEADREAMAMRHGGAAWRGWFPIGGELTSSVPDRKEGIYFGAELGPDDPRVIDGLPLHGPNLFPERLPAMRDAVLEWIDAMTALGHRLMRGVALGLGLEAGWFDEHLTADPITLFRIFRYPSIDADLESTPSTWGVAEHTDYGLLTILHQDHTGGLEVRTPTGWDDWVEVPVQPDTLVCNVGDMLDRMTAGRYRSTPHRVRSPRGRQRLSYAFFFDPAWDAKVVPVPVTGPRIADSADARWDHKSVDWFEGTYGEYLWAKVGRVFPDLRASVDPPNRQR